MQQLVKKLSNLSSRNKGFLIIFSDIISSIISLFISYYIVLNILIIQSEIYLPIIVSSFSFIITLFFINSYNQTQRLFFSRIFINALIAGTISTFSLLILFLSTFKVNYLAQVLTFYFLFIIFIYIFIRYIVNQIFTYFKNKSSQTLEIILWGFSNNLEYALSFLKDNNYSISNYIITNELITSEDKIKKKILSEESFLLNSKKYINNQIIIINDNNFINLNLKKIIQLKENNFIIKILNTHKNTFEVKDFNNLSITDLLHRQQTNPSNNLMKLAINNKNIIVTGAAGSIGNTILKQLLNYNPSSILCIDASEIGIYNLMEKYRDDSRVSYKLGNLLDIKFVENIFNSCQIDLVFHTAAYKHVNIIEDNVAIGIKNNIISTYNLLKSCYNSEIQEFVLISSDKAVRSSNIMGATKKFAEKIVLFFNKKYHDEGKNINYKIVRFGNVLESSGSVIPRFNKQISEGGPLTVTHKEVKRYFMTLDEAANLVIQSSQLNDLGFIYTLKMGNLIKIYDLALKMIHLRGLKLKETEDGDGDIYIKITGLKKGEKLIEELYDYDNFSETENSLIIKSKAENINIKDLEFEINNILKLSYDNREGKEFLINSISDYKPN